MEQNHQNDRDTARRIADGDARTTESFVTRHYTPLCRFLLHLTGRMEDAEDLTQQAFVKAKQQIASYRGRASLRTWLYRIAFHEYTRWRRKHRPTHGLERAPAHIEPGFERCIEATALLDGLSRLPDQLRETFLLHEVQELSIEETAKVLGVPQGTVKSRLYKARQRLSLWLGDRRETENELQPIFES